jgi:uncharacterized protein YfaS (alpha-2-macroglobulin family)
MPKVGIAQGTARVQFSRTGPLTAYSSVNESGFDRNPPAAEITQGIEIFREFLDAKGNVVTKVTVGQDFLVRLRVRATRRDRQSQIAIVDLLPGGVEPVLERQPTADSSTPDADPALAQGRRAAGSLPIGLPDKSTWFPDHIDVRDDRLILYGDVTKDAGTFVYRVRATNSGAFQTPPAFAEGMYDRTVVGSSKGGRLEIVKP